VSRRPAGQRRRPAPRAAAPGREHGHGQPGGFGAHGNPRDFRLMLGRLEDPARARWQRPARLVRALGLRPGQIVAEIGSGSGYMVRRLARAVGPRGHVYAVDAEPRMLPILVERLRRARIGNVTPVLAPDADPFLPDRAVDLVLVVNTYHHFPGGPRYLRRLARLLRRGGRLVNVDFHRRETPVGPPLERRIARETFLRDARRAGLRLVREITFLPYQYGLVLRPG
jgi:ubiquinone/menaquinone biosynthesis C-methylase UbiE